MCLAPGTSTRTTMPGTHHLAVHAENTALDQSAEMSVTRNPCALPLVLQLELPCQALIILLSTQRIQLLTNLRRCLLRGTHVPCPWYFNSNYHARHSSSCCPRREYSS